jgi:hypothetical protein
MLKILHGAVAVENYYLTLVHGATPGAFTSPAVTDQIGTNITEVAGTSMARILLTRGSDFTFPGYTFTITAGNATVGDTYTNNTKTFTVLATAYGDTVLYCSGTGDPAASGTLTRATGTGDATITFSAVSTVPNVAIVTAKTFTVGGVDWTSCDGWAICTSSTLTTADALWCGIFHNTAAYPGIQQGLHGVGETINVAPVLMLKDTSQ